MNLITDAWLPVSTPEGVQDAAPIDIALLSADGPATGRADFDAVAYEFLIGLYQTCAPPESDRAWAKWAESPPDAATVRSLFAPFLPAFEIDHPEQPFLQERSLDGVPTNEITDLLIDSPGAATIKDNKDHFIKRREGGRFCEPCATLALLTLQNFSPAGGKGNMTSVRGGGPLTTIVMGTALWETVWRNVAPPAELGATPAGPDAAIFPWLHAATPPLEKRAALTVGEAHPFHAFWGMPRRILLTPGEVGSDPCTLCGRVEGRKRAAYHARPYGFDYKGSWTHPLSPIQENKGVLSSRKGRADAGGYRQWVGLVVSSEDGAHRPAPIVHLARSSARRVRLVGNARIRAAGYAMDNAKVEGWYEGSMPLLPGEPAVLQHVDAHARDLVKGTREAEGMLRSTYKEAHAAELKGSLGHVTKPLWSRTEAEFYASLQVVMQDVDARKVERVAWWQRLRADALAIFATHVQYTRIGDADAQRIVLAERKLRSLLRRQLPKKLDLSEEDITPKMIS